MSHSLYGDFLPVDETVPIIFELDKYAQQGSFFASYQRSAWEIINLKSKYVYESALIIFS